MDSNFIHTTFVFNMKNENKKTRLEDWCQLVAALMNSEQLTALKLDMEVFDCMIFSVAVEWGLSELSGSTLESQNAFSDAINRGNLKASHVMEAVDWYLIQGNEEGERMEDEPQDREGGEYSDWIQENGYDKD